MTSRKNIGSYLIITAVTVLIWYWAAGETRQQGTVSVTVKFVPADLERWVVAPDQLTVTLRIDGSRIALQNAVTALKTPLDLELASFEGLAERGSHMVSFVDVLSDHQRIRETRVNISSAEPSAGEITVAEIVRHTVPIRITLPAGVQTEGETRIEPAEAYLIGPGLPEDPAGLEVEAVVDSHELARLEPGRSQTLPVTLRTKGVAAANDSVRIEPLTAQVTLTVRSRIRQTTLEKVRVHLQSAPENTEEYSVQFNDADKDLENVTITADDELIRRIDSGEVKVFAVIYLTTTDFDQRITEKPVAQFITDTGVNVQGMSGDSPEPPTIGFTITERQRPGP